MIWTQITTSGSLQPSGGDVFVLKTIKGSRGVIREKCESSKLGGSISNWRMSWEI